MANKPLLDFVSESSVGVDLPFSIIYVLTAKGRLEKGVFSRSSTRSGVEAPATLAVISFFVELHFHTLEIPIEHLG